MGLFDFFQKKKMQKEEGVQGGALKSATILDDQGGQLDTLGLCQQLVEVSKVLKESKKEYQKVTGLLKDIQEIENIPEGPKAELLEVAKEIISLQEKRRSFQKATIKISNIQYMQIEKNEEEIPYIIQRMKENEAYQSAVKQDMNHLEGEKSMWKSQRKTLQNEKRILKNAMLTIGVLFIISMVVLTSVQIYSGKSMLLGYLFSVLVLLVSFFGVYLKIQANTTELDQSEINMNNAIVMLNRMKIKYVNFTNVVDYAYDKYSVHSSHELNYLFEQYLEAKEDRKRYQRTTGDLEVNSEKLVLRLRRFRLTDPDIWVHQITALINEKELELIKLELGDKRKKLRTRMEADMEQYTKLRDGLEGYMKKNPANEKEITSILSSIDSIGII